MAYTEIKNAGADIPGPVSIAPWLSVRDSAKAVQFYKAAFGAVDAYWLDIPDGSVVAQLTIDGAAFWVGQASPDNSNRDAGSSSAGSILLIFTVPDPVSFFTRALQAGASQVYPVTERHG